MRCSSTLRIRFLSTPSARRATSVTERQFASLQISIHALREEGDETAQGKAYR